MFLDIYILGHVYLHRAACGHIRTLYIDKRCREGCPCEEFHSLRPHPTRPAPPHTCCSLVRDTTKHKHHFNHSSACQQVINMVLVVWDPGPPEPVLYPPLLTVSWMGEGWHIARACGLASLCKRSSRHGRLPAEQALNNGVTPSIVVTLT